MQPRTVLALVLLQAPLACASPEPQPVPARRAPERHTVSPSMPRTADVPPPVPPAAPVDGGELERSTTALLERIFAPPPQTRASSSESAAPAPAAPTSVDERPLALLAPWELGLGPFAVAGQELPAAALQYSLGRALAGRFAAGGPLRGPELVDPAALPGTSADEPLALVTPLADPLRSELRARGARWLVAGRLERLDQERTTVYLSRARRYARQDRALLTLSYRLIDLDTGALARAGRFERSYELGGLSSAELASVEWVLAWEAARLLSDDLAREWPPAAAAPAPAGTGNATGDSTAESGSTEEGAEREP